MDPLTPVSGISIEQYAALLAEVAAARGDATKIAEATAKSSISATDWQQAQAGWATRLAHPLMGPAIAVRFEPLYHDALDRLLGSAPGVPADDFAMMWSEALAIGLPAMWQERGLDALTWSRISYRCRAALATDPGALAASLAVAHLTAERRLADPEGWAKAAAAEPKTGANAPPPARKFDKDATVAAKAVGKAVLSGLDAFGAAMDGLGKSLLRPSVGAAVLVQWSDGKKYPGTVAKTGDGQIMVTMTDGSQHWVPDAYVKPV